MSWTAPPAERSPAPGVGEERRMLRGFVDYQRQTLLRKCQGLTAEQLKTPAVPPSGLTLAGLIRHMTDVERAWFADARPAWICHRSYIHAGAARSAFAGSISI